MNYDAAGYAMALFFMYFLPTILAARGRRGSVFTVNLLLGWTLIGWCVAMFMAVRSMEDAKRGA